MKDDNDKYAIFVVEQGNLEKTNPVALIPIWFYLGSYQTVNQAEIQKIYKQQKGKF